MAKPTCKIETTLTHAGRNPQANFGIVNPPVYHASTVLFPNLESLESGSRDGLSYGRHGTPTTFALQDAVAAAEGAEGAIALPSGYAAVAATLLAFVKSGDHVLMADHVYGPARRCATAVLARFGVETTFFDPMIGAGIAALFRENTRLLYLESPGSLTFEVQDVPALAAAAKARGVPVALDNTWAAPLFFRPLDHGVDLSVIAATKYIVGHSDVMMGIVAGNGEALDRVRASVRDLGYHAAPDDCYLAMRGLRTAAVRLRQHEAQGLALAAWLQRRPEVRRVLHPALPDHPGHEFWKRDFTGASGLFGLVLEPVAKPALAAMLDGMSLFGMGYSWGGFESLLIPTHPETIRTATRWEPGGTTLRIHAGLEHIDDLKDDLDRGFAAIARGGVTARICCFCSGLSATDVFW